ncbi:MAG TPA: hypothetical protein VK724_19540 [Bryobacteraceae bacterium]|jgi:hypothetical protein|nr:hypothetical protein [Bryobacteraceae bacterium]
MKNVPKMSKAEPTPAADQIAEMATQSEDISAYFTNRFAVVKAAQPGITDLTQQKNQHPTRRKPTSERV